MEVGFKSRACCAALNTAWHSRAQYRIAEHLLRGADLAKLALRVESDDVLSADGAWQKSKVRGTIETLSREALARSLGPERGGGIVRSRSAPGGLWVHVVALGVDSLVFWMPPIVLDHDTRGGTVVRRAGEQLN